MLVALAISVASNFWRRDYGKVTRSDGVEMQSQDDQDEVEPSGRTKGHTAKEMLANTPVPKGTEEDMRAAAEAPARAERPLREQIAHEIAVCQCDLQRMQALGSLDRDTQARIHSDIAERLRDLDTLEKLGGE